MFDYKNFIKYILEGFAVIISAFFIFGQNNYDMYKLIVLGLTAAAVYAILDNYSPTISDSTRRGSGLGIGWSMLKI